MSSRRPTQKRMNVGRTVVKISGMLEPQNERQAARLQIATASGVIDCGTLDHKGVGLWNEARCHSETAIWRNNLEQLPGRLEAFRTCGVREELISGLGAPSLLIYLDPLSSAYYASRDI